MLMVFCCVRCVFADPGAADVRQGNAAYSKGDFGSALDHYKAAAVVAPNDPRVDYDLGTAAYKNGEFNASVANFNKALLTDNDALRLDAQYNLANALYEAGLKVEDKDLSAAIKNIKESLEHYDKVLASSRRHEDAAFNRPIAAAELERLNKKQEDQNSKQQGSKQQNSKQQDPGKQEPKEEPSKQDGQQGSPDQKPDDPQAQQKKQEPSKDDPRKADADKADKPKDKGASAGQSGQDPLLSQDEANLLLDDFAQNEQPKGMLNFDREPRRERPVLKDW